MYKLIIKYNKNKKIKKIKSKDILEDYEVLYRVLQILRKIKIK